MSTAVAAVRFGAMRLGLSATQDAVAVVGLAAFVGGLLAATWGTWGDLDLDTGYDIVAGSRVASGDVPYVDFTYYYGPLAPALMGLVSLLGGAGVAPAVAFGLAVTIGILAATYALARTLLDPLGAFLATAITAAVALSPNNFGFVLPHTYAATLGTLLLLVALLCVGRFAASGDVRWLVVAGTSVGCVALTKPEVALAAFAAAAAWLALRARAGLLTRRAAAALAAPAALVPAVVYGGFFAAVSPHRLVLENLYPVDQFDAGMGTMLHARLPLTLESAAVLGGRVLLYLGGAAVLLLVAWAVSRPGRVGRFSLAATMVGACAALAVAALNPEALRHGLQYVYGWIPGGAAIAVVLLYRRIRPRIRDLTARDQVAFAGAVALAALAATTYGAFFLHAPHPQMAVYAAPLAAIFLTRLHLGELGRHRSAYALGALWIAFLAAAGAGLTLKDARAESFTVQGPGGALAETPAEGALYQSALRWISATTEPGEPILVAPLMTGLYTLADREAPLDEIAMLPAALPTLEGERAAVAGLERARVRLVITDSRGWPGYGHTSFGQSFHRSLAGWIERHFDRAATLRSEGPEPRMLSVWLRRGP